MLRNKKKNKFTVFGMGNTKGDKLFIFVFNFLKKYVLEIVVVST